MEWGVASGVRGAGVCRGGVVGMAVRCCQAALGNSRMLMLVSCGCGEHVAAAHL